MTEETIEKAKHLRDILMDSISYYESLELLMQGENVEKIDKTIAAYVSKSTMDKLNESVDQVLREEHQRYGSLIEEALNMVSIPEVAVTPSNEFVPLAKAVKQKWQK